ncbi:1-deoxy-D-xylulose-5-phosphate reductoisomerase [Telmatospirillum siberiense]|uniref:1-deoxy-D-xylulose 5-phosphate reductoisomerase n=1 Tax=Telmatospirillum siberiense TaxID=382514 RepID=A0A2N3PZK3_9PROT|nr:1-deoxy-D-xylulose-5-phosphate reductoisomerase [Telmatospirillum siberiense]PKU25791.1 1-deoxy-D-xylulose-5-phosphate reductoisomerase [Telmatospirillum siberiense]
MSSEKRSVTILGSTGSVGCNTVDLIEREPDRFVVEALVANRNVAKLAEQAKLLRPRLVVVAQENAYLPLKEALAGSNIEVAAGRAAVVEAAARPADWVMSAIVGAAGLEPTLAAIRRGAMVGLANKETLVCAGTLVMGEVERHGATLIPVDSEHSAIFQVLDTTQRDRIDKIILTASGGPFRRFSSEQMASVTPEQAVAHPNWDMGAKISVDSASMMNKGLELIEAYHLFGLPEDRIDILVHPQSVVHSMVSYIDGSVLAQLGTPDMRTPISLALGWPKRMATPGKRLDLGQVGTLTFEAPDPERFPALRLARDVLRKGGAAPTILNAANEVAVQAFLDRKIGFLDIVRLVEQAVSALGDAPLNVLADVLACDAQAREVARGLVAGLSR